MLRTKLPGVLMATRPAGPHPNESNYAAPAGVVRSLVRSHTTATTTACSAKPPFRLAGGSHHGVLGETTVPTRRGQPPPGPRAKQRSTEGELMRRHDGAKRRPTRAARRRAAHNARARAPRTTPTRRSSREAVSPAEGLAAYAGDRRPFHQPSRPNNEQTLTPSPAANAESRGDQRTDREQCANPQVRGPISSEGNSRPELRSGALSVACAARFLTTPH